MILSFVDSSFEITSTDARPNGLLPNAYNNNDANLASGFCLSDPLCRKSHSQSIAGTHRGISVPAELPGAETGTDMNSSPPHLAHLSHCSGS